MDNIYADIENAYEEFGCSIEEAAQAIKEVSVALSQSENSFELVTGTETSDLKSPLEIFKPVCGIMSFPANEDNAIIKDDVVTLSKKEYKELLKDSLALQYLEAGGVDNWSWYGDSFNEDYYKELEEIERL